MCFQITICVVFLKSLENFVTHGCLYELEGDDSIVGEVEISRVAP